MFTLEINGRAVAVIEADEEQARDLVEDEDFQDDLQSMESEGEPLWDGTTPLIVRRSTQDEIEASQAALGEDDEDEDDDEAADGELFVVFIVPVDEDLGDEDDDLDDDEA